VLEYGSHLPECLKLKFGVEPQISALLSQTDFESAYVDSEAEALTIRRQYPRVPADRAATRIQATRVLIFLDFDGVLRRKRSPLYRLDSDCLSVFEKAVRRCPDAQIVITSSWREAFSLSQIRGLFSADIAVRIIGVTPIEPTDWRCEDHHRYREVMAFLKRNGHTSTEWIALDDDPSHYPTLRNLIIVDAERGFDSEVAGRLASAVLDAR
jgi:hypothetical protein